MFPIKSYLRSYFTVTEKNISLCYNIFINKTEENHYTRFTMKKIILLIYLIVAMNLYGSNKLECENLFRSAISNFYLENSCKYDKHLSSAIRKEFENKNCTKLFSDDDMKRFNSEVLGNSYKNMKKIGRDNFCSTNKVTYDELSKIYLQKTH